MGRRSAFASTNVDAEIFGVRVAIRAADPHLLDQVVSRLPPGWTPATSNRVDRTYRFTRAARENGAIYRVDADDTVLCESRHIDRGCEHFQSDLELFIAVHARTRAVVHAGVVGWQGRAILIPGRSFSGKTTLVAALVRMGAEYYSDEYAVLDERGRAWPFPTPLHVRHGPNLRTRCRPEQLGGSVGQRPVPVGLILVTRFDPAAVWRPEPLTPGRAVLALLANSPAARHQPQFLLATFRRAVRGAVTLEGCRGDADEFARLLLTQAPAKAG